MQPFILYYGVALLCILPYDPDIPFSFLAYIVKMENQRHLKLALKANYWNFKFLVWSDSWSQKRKKYQRLLSSYIRIKLFSSWTVKPYFTGIFSVYLSKELKKCIYPHNWHLGIFQIILNLLKNDTSSYKRNWERDLSLKSPPKASNSLLIDGEDVVVGVRTWNRSWI